jgi:hypothetical protein
MFNNQSPTLVPDPHRLPGTRVICIAYRMVATIPYLDYLDYQQYRRVQVLDYSAAIVHDCRTGAQRSMTDAEIERVSRVSQEIKRVA